MVNKDSKNKDSKITPLSGSHPHDISIEDANLIIENYNDLLNGNVDAIRYHTMSAKVLRDYLSNTSISSLRIILAKETSGSGNDDFTFVFAGYDNNIEPIPTVRNTYLEHIEPITNEHAIFTTSNITTWQQQVLSDNSSITQHDISKTNANTMIGNYLSLNHPENFITSFEIKANELREYLLDGSIHSVHIVGAINETGSYTLVIAGKNTEDKFVLNERNNVFEYVIPCAGCRPDNYID